MSMLKFNITKLELMHLFWTKIKHRVNNCVVCEVFGASLSTYSVVDSVVENKVFQVKKQVDTEFPQDTVVEYGYQAAIVYTYLVTMCNCNFPSYQQLTILKLEKTDGQIIVKHSTKFCTVSNPSLLWPLLHIVQML